MAPFKRTLRLAVAAQTLALSCQPQPAAAPRFEAEGPACRQHQAELVELVRKLPERTVPAWLEAELPESPIGAVPGGDFPVLQITETSARFDGASLSGESTSERAGSAAAAVRQYFAATSEKPRREPPWNLYLAAAPAVDVQTLRGYLTALPSEVSARLLVRGPAPEHFAAGAPQGPAANAEDAEARAIANQLFAERDPQKRSALSSQAFASFSRCKRVSDALAAVGQVDPKQRWTALRAALLEALPACRCDELASQSLKQIVVAEQRAGSGSIAALPAEFLRDERCGASMPLRSLGKLVAQMESFNAEFSGGYQKDELAFEEVLTNDRLLNTFCNALPGETLAALERKRATLYWKLSGEDACEAFRFEPLSPGAPMGTLRQVVAAGQGARAFHYWQAAEEIRLFGPVSGAPESKPTDSREWACDQNLKLTGVDVESVSFEHGRWFFREDACRRAKSDTSSLTGCFSARASSAP